MPSAAAEQKMFWSITPTTTFQNLPMPGLIPVLVTDAPITLDIGRNNALNLKFKTTQASIKEEVLINVSQDSKTILGKHHIMSSL